jgi:hypothetical protein
MVGPPIAREGWAAGTHMVTPLFRCPKTGGDIPADFDADLQSLSLIRLFRVRVFCPRCQEVHELQVSDARPDGPRVV